MLVFSLVEEKNEEVKYPVMNVQKVPMPVQKKQAASQKKKRSIVDPLAYYHEHYPNLTRGQLQRKDQSLYQQLRRRDLLREVPVQNSRMLMDPLTYYHEHYPNLTRGQLRREDPTLYHKLWRKGLLSEVSLQ